MSRPIGIALIAAAVFVAACQGGPPQRPLQLPASSLEVRQLQTRRFAAISERELLAASAAVLQDLGFNIDDSEAELGLIVASKRQSASDPGVERFLDLLEIFADVDVAVDKEQRIRASLVSRPVAGSDDEHLVRVTFQRVVWNTDEQITKRQTLNEPLIYQEFFDRLAKSVFLEAQSI